MKVIHPGMLVGLVLLLNTSARATSVDYNRIGGKQGVKSMKKGIHNAEPVQDDVVSRPNKPSKKTGKPVFPYTKPIKTPVFTASNVPAPSKAELKPTPMKVPTGTPTIPAKVPSNTPVTPAKLPSTVPTIPVKHPSRAPTNPVKHPSRTPTNPVKHPSGAPTHPVKLPSKVPTIPVKHPSRVPTYPVKFPSKVPTIPVKYPSSVPTLPAKLPSEAPTTPFTISSNAPTNPVKNPSYNTKSPTRPPSNPSTHHTTTPVHAGPTSTTLSPSSGTMPIDNPASNPKSSFPSSPVYVDPPYSSPNPTPSNPSGSNFPITTVESTGNPTLLIPSSVNPSEASQPNSPSSPSSLNSSDFPTPIGELSSTPSWSLPPSEFNQPTSSTTPSTPTLSPSPSSINPFDLNRPISSSTPTGSPLPTMDAPISPVLSPAVFPFAPATPSYNHHPKYTKKPTSHPPSSTTPSALNRPKSSPAPTGSPTLTIEAPISPVVPPAIFPFAPATPSNNPHSKSTKKPTSPPPSSTNPSALNRPNSSPTPSIEAPTSPVFSPASVPFAPTPPTYYPHSKSTKKPTSSRPSPSSTGIPSIPYPASSNPSGERQCLLNATGFFGSSAGSEMIIRFRYELEIESSTIADKVIPRLERSFNAAILPALFSDLCVPYHMKTGWHRLVSERQVKGISTKPDDQTLASLICRQEMNNTNTCHVVAGGLTVFVDSESNDVKNQIIDILQDGMVNDKFLEADDGIKRVTFLDQTPSTNGASGTDKAPSTGHAPGPNLNILWGILAALAALLFLTLSILLWRRRSEYGEEDDSIRSEGRVHRDDVETMADIEPSPPEAT